MAVEVRIEGLAAFGAVARQMRAQGNKTLEREMIRALDRTVKPVEAAVRAEYENLPSRGGYAATFSRSLRLRLGRRTGGRSAQLTIRAYAEGTSQRRDIEALEDGRLRHPVYGRSRPTRRGRRGNPWAVTAVRGGYFRRGTDDAADSAEKAMAQVVQEFAEKLI